MKLSYAICVAAAISAGIISNYNSRLSIFIALIIPAVIILNVLFSKGSSTWSEVEALLTNKDIPVDRWISRAKQGSSNDLRYVILELLGLEGTDKEQEAFEHATWLTELFANSSDGNPFNNIAMSVMFFGALGKTEKVKYWMSVLRKTPPPEFISEMPEQLRSGMSLVEYYNDLETRALTKNFED